MNNVTIEQAFSVAMTHAEKLYGKRGFQAEVSRMSGIDSSNVNSIVKRGKGTKEPVRRAIFAAAIEITEELAGMGYDEFIDMGKRLAGGECASAQTTITGSPGSCSPVTATDVRNSKISVNHTQTSYHQGTPAGLSESERRIIEALRLIDCKDYTNKVVEKIEAAVKVLKW